MEDNDRTVTFRSNRHHGDVQPARTKTYYSSNNVTAQLTNDLRLKFAVNLSPSKEEGRLPAIDGFGQPDGELRHRPGAAEPERTRATPTTSSTATGSRACAAGTSFVTLHESGVFEGTRYVFNSSTNIGMPGVPENLQRATGLHERADQLAHRTGTSRSDSTSRPTRPSTPTSRGTHAFKGGVQMDYIAQDILSGKQGNVINLNWGQSARARPRRRVSSATTRCVSNGVFPDLGFITQGKVGNTNVGLFFQDAWTINNKFTVNLGLRTENESVPSLLRGPEPAGPGPRVHLRRQAGAARGLCVGHHRRRQEQGLRQLGDLLRHPQARTGADLVRRRQVDLPLLHARHAELGHARRLRLPAGLPGHVPGDDRLPASRPTRPSTRTWTR